MNEIWREILYPLGYLSALAFGARFVLQWLMSEWKGKSVVPRAFWQLSLVGNCLLVLHSLIQMQFHVCLVQGCNAIISWRNLNLMQLPERRVKLHTVIELFSLTCVSIVLLFLIEGYYSPDGVVWFRVPLSLEVTSNTPVGLGWHLLGFLGLILFSSRFWVQWWEAEREQSSQLGLSFWWLSLSGGLISLVYFARIDDWVNLIGPLFGLIPYLRNIMLVRASEKH